jgi:putative aminopeptidase FrvX
MILQTTKGEMLMKNMKKQLIELLGIHAVSGNEKPVRQYLQVQLSSLVDKMHTDEYGNLLAEVKVGSGEGATILLSAHMDTVKGVLADRELTESKGVIMSDKGVLGADDRAGIAIILTVLRNVKKLRTFNGVIKIAFSREEEIGCIGAGKINPEWYKDVDLAIVVDRQGNRDIVVGCGMAFCSNNVGLFMENVSQLVEMDWICVEGGISDAMVFSENGINSVNISAGYMNEHTNREFVSIDDMKDTVLLIMQTLITIGQFRDTFGKVPSENTWVKAWKVCDYKYDDSRYYEDAYSNDIWAQVDDKEGDVYCYEMGNGVVIQQGENEIILSKDSLRRLIDQLKIV